MTDKPTGFFEGTEMPNAGWWEALWPNPAGVIATVGIEPGMEVIDLCSGDGWFTLHIAKIARRVIAIDIDRDLLTLARHRLTERGITNCEFIPADAYDICRHWTDPVDFIFMANAFHGVPDRSGLAHVVWCALRLGGRFAVVNWYPRPREETVILGEPRGPKTEMRMSPEAVREGVEPSRLKLSTVVDIPPYHYGAIFERLV